METIKDLFRFIKERKKYWLVPVIVILFLVGIIIVFGANSALAPFVYSLF